MKRNPSRKLWGVLGKQQNYLPKIFQGQTIPLNANPLEPWDSLKSRYRRVDLVPKAEQAMENIQQGGVVSAISVSPTPVASATPTPTPSSTPTPTPTPTTTSTPTPTLTPTATIPPFSPLDIAGLELWLESTTGITTSSGNITSWEDELSGSNRVATPSDSTKFTLGDVLNGYTGVTNATGSTASMSLSSATSSMSAWTVFVVHRLTATPPTASYSYFLGEDSELSGLAVAQFNLTGPLIWKNPLALTSGSTSLNTNYYSTYQYSPTLNQIRRNGALVVSDGGASGTWVFNRIFENTAAGSRTFRGTIWELLIYNSKLSASDITDVETYLADKYNL